MSVISTTERNEKNKVSIMLKNTVTLPGHDKKRLYGNTFKMEPDIPFSVTMVEKILKELMDKEFENHIYDENKSLKKCVDLSAEIRNRVDLYLELIKTKWLLFYSQVKTLNFSRYKLICLVTVAEKRFSEVMMNSRSLWDPRFDNHASYTFTNKYLIAVGVVYGCYYE